MASTYSTNLKIELIGTGEGSGTWGQTTNTNLGTALEEAIVGRGVATFTSDADLTLTLTNSNASQVARAFAIRVESSVSLTATRNLIVPTMYKPYIVNNVTTGGQSIVIKTASGAGVTVPNGSRVFVYVNSTDAIEVLNYISALSLGTDLAIADGGTGASTAAGARTNLGASTVGANLFTAANPSAITFVRINADNTVSLLDAATFRTAIGAGTGSGDVTGPASAVSANVATFNGTTGKVIQDSGKALPSGALVGASDSQTLTNKTLTAPTVSGATLNSGYTEQVYAVSGTTPALSPTNGSIQTWTLSGNSTPTAGTWADGQSLTLMVDDGAAYTITWTSVAVTWKTNNGVAPTLLTSGYTPITLWKVGGVIYGARVGNA